MNEADKDRKRASDPTTVEIHDVRSHLVDSALVLFALLTPLALSVSVFRIQQRGWHPVYVLHLGAAAAIVASAIFRRRLAYWIRASVLLGFNLVLGVAHVPVFGHAGGGRASLVVFAVLTALVYGTRAGLIACGAAVGISLAAAVAAFTGAARLIYDVEQQALSPITWAVQLSIFIVWTPVIIIAIGVVQTHLAESLRNVLKKEQRLIAAQRIAGMGDFTWDVATGEVTWSDALCDLLGYDKSEPIDFRMVNTRIHHPDDVQRITDWLNACIASGGDALTPNEYRLIRKDGQTRYVHTTGLIERGPGGSVRVFATVEDVTERKQAEESIRESEERYRTIFEGRSQGFYLMTDVFLDCNAQACSLWACRREDIIGHSPVEFSPTVQPDGRPSEIAAREHIQAAQAGTPQRFYWQHKRKDGVLIDCEVTLDALTVRGQPLLLASVSDISERKRAEDALQRLTAILEATSDLVSIALPDMTVTYMNKAGRRLLGWTDDKTPQDVRISDVHPKWAFELLRDRAIPYAFEHGIWQGETAIFGPTAEEIPVSQVVMAHRDRSGQVEYMSTIIRDIRQRKEAELQLQQEKAFSDAVINALPGIFYVYEEGQRLIRWNLNHETSTGYTAEELSRKNPLDWFEGEDREIVKTAVRQTMEIGHATAAADLVIKDGTHVSYLLTGTRLERDGKRYLLGVGIDVTERKRAQEALMLTQFSIDHASDAAFWMGPDARFMYVNQAACKGLGYSCEELLNMSVYDIDPYFTREVWKASWEQLRQNKVMRFETFHRTKDGRVFPVEISANFLEFMGRQFDCAFAHDITRRKAVEQEREGLLRTLAARNEELESIIYVSSHDLRSPLINIEGFAGELEAIIESIRAVLRTQPTDAGLISQMERMLEEDIPESLQFISAGVRRMSALLDGLLRLCRLGRMPLEIQHIDGQKTLALILDAMRYQIDQADMQVVLDPDVPDCMADPNLFNQIFTNLLDNAIKYRNPDRRAVVHISGYTEKDQTVYQVADNGRGIAPQHQKKVFEVFHRLEPNNGIGGEGLGLTIVKRLLFRLGGTISLDSQLGSGTTFTIRLPRS